MAVFFGKIETEFRIIEKHVRRVGDPIVGYLTNEEDLGSRAHGPFKTKKAAQNKLLSLMRLQMRGDYKRVKGNDMALQKDLSKDEIDDDVAEDKICYAFEEVILSKKTISRRH